MGLPDFLHTPKVAKRYGLQGDRHIQTIIRQSTTNRKNNNSVPQFHLEKCLRENCLGIVQLGMLLCIGACRAVWVPGQDLAMLHLMGNCGKRVLSLHCTLYVHLCTHMLYDGDHVSSHPVLVI